MTDATSDSAGETGRSLGWLLDLLAVGSVAVLAAGVILIDGTPWPLDWLLGVLLLLFLPGYAVIAALFPERARREGLIETTVTDEVPSLSVRVVLSVPTSAILVAVVGISLAVFGALTPFAVVGTVAVVTLVGVTVATARREQRHQSVRAGLSASDGLSGWTDSRNPTQTATMLVAALVLLGTVTFAGATPAPDRGYTEFYLATEQPDEDLVASGFPDTVTAGEGTNVSVVVENREGRQVSYNVVVLAQTVGPDDSVTEQERVGSVSTVVEPGERAVLNRSVAPTVTGESVRLRFLLYEGPAPDDPSAENAALSLRLWVTVEPSAE